MRLIKWITSRWRSAGAGGAAALTYSQCGEDVIANFIFDSLGIRSGVFLDIGANHPTKYNNTYSLYRKGWRGFNVDPLRDHINLFNKVRPQDKNIWCGIGSQTGERTLYEMDPPTLSTFDAEVAERYKQAGHTCLAARVVPFYCVPDLLSRHSIPDSLDFLSVDVEGGDIDIIRSFGKTGCRPKVIVMETVAYSQGIQISNKMTGIIRSIEEDFGYFSYADTFINTIFVRRDLIG